MSELFGDKLRRLRDGELTPQNSFLLRHGGTFMGVTFHLWSVHSIDRLTIDDIKWSLIAAVESQQSTDLQLHFAKEGVENIELILIGISKDLDESGFEPMSISAKFNGRGIGWLRIALFEVGNLPVGREDFTVKHNV